MRIGPVLALVSATLLLVLMPTTAAYAADCESSSVILGDCSVTPSTGDGDVTLTGDVSNNGSDDSNSRSENTDIDRRETFRPKPNDRKTGTETDTETDTGTDTGSESDTDTDTDTDGDGDDTTTAPLGLDPGCSQELLCIDTVLVEENIEQETETVIPDVTIRDVESFEAQTGADEMEPDGWGVVRLNANFYSNAEQHVRIGRLFGVPAAVRFTPYAWHWDYGDGETLNSDDPGASWEDLGLDEFSRTDTSHEFKEPGTYDVVLTVDFHAEYRFRGGQWTPVDGTVSRTADTVTATIGTASTVLVSGECTSKSASAGC